jgi:hypothetical protein
LIEESKVRFLTVKVEKIAVLEAREGRTKERLRIAERVLVDAGLFTSIKKFFLTI